MNFKKKLLKLSPVVLMFPILGTTIVSCSNFKDQNTWATETSITYNNIWNLTNIPSLTEEQINNSIYSMTLEELENKINSQIDKNSLLKKQLKVLCMNLLWNSIRYPYDSNGSVISTLTENLKNYTSFLSEFIAPDETNGDTYNKLNSFLNTFMDIRINVLGFSGNKPNEVKIDKQLKVGEIINEANTLNVLQFQIEFKINNDDANTKIINSTNGKSIFYRTSATREQKQLIQTYSKNPELSALIANQFNYQGTKMYYDIESKTFKTIVLGSNVRYGEKNSTANSGFIAASDLKRTLIYFDYKQISNNKWDTYLIINLSDSNYFNISGINSNWEKYLKQEDLIEDGKMLKMEINLNKTISYNPSDYES